MTNDYFITLFYVFFPYLLNVASFSASSDYNSETVITAAEATELRGCVLTLCVKCCYCMGCYNSLCACAVTELFLPE